MAEAYRVICTVRHAATTEHVLSLWCPTLAEGLHMLLVHQQKGWGSVVLVPQIPHAAAGQLVLFGVQDG